MAESERNIVASSNRPLKGIRIYIAFIALVTVFSTALIAWGTQTIIGGNEQPAEGNVTDGVRVFHVSVKEWEFEPAVMKVYPGEKVRFIVYSDDVWHGFAINELNVNLTVPSEKTVSTEVSIPAEASGKIYTSYCSVFCGLGHPYLKGKIIVGNPELFMGVGIGKTLPYAATLVMAGILTIVIVIGKNKARKQG